MKFADRYHALCAEVLGADLDATAAAPLAREVGLVDDDDGLRVARGDSFLDDGDEAQLRSPLDGVDDQRWTQFARGMVAARPGDVSPSNAVGMFLIMPRRLADLGLVRGTQRTRSPEGKTIYVAAFVPPLTCQRFLADPEIQYLVFCQSICDYDERMRSGEIERVPGMSRSGALAVLHRCGPHGMKTWAEGDRFPQTQAAFDRVEGIF